MNGSAPGLVERQSVAICGAGRMSVKPRAYPEEFRSDFVKIVRRNCGRDAKWVHPYTPPGFICTQLSDRRSTPINRYRMPGRAFSI
jgi:hypothetical protein